MTTRDSDALADLLGVARGEEPQPQGEVEAVDWSRDDEPVWTVRCLVCDTTVQVAVHSDGPRRCTCGVFWSVEVIAVGTRGVAVR